MHDFWGDFRWADRAPTPPPTAGLAALHSGREACPRPRAPRAGRSSRGGSSPRSTRTPGGPVSAWLDLEPARRRAVAADAGPRPRLASSIASRSRRSTTIWPAGCASRRWADLRRWVRAARRRTTTTRARRPTTSRFGPPILRPPSLRDFYAFEGHVATMWQRRDAEVPEAWYRLPIFYFSNVSEIRGPDEPVWAPRGSSELDYELEVAALVDTPARDLPAERGRGGDRRLHGLQRLVGARPAARRDDGPARAGQGQGLRELDRAVARDARRAGVGAAGRCDRPGPRDDRRRSTASRRRAARWSDGPVQLRRDARAGLGGRPAATRRPDRLGDGR